MKRKNVTILGGFGSVGIQVAQYLLQKSDFDITLAGRSKRLLQAKVIDVNNHQAMYLCCQESDLIISCIGPSGLLGDQVPKICKANNTPLVDAGGYDPVLHSLDAANKKNPSKVPLIINVGLLPGISGIFPTHVINCTAMGRKIEQLEVQYVGRDAWTYNSAWDIINGLGDFGTEKGFCYTNREKIIKVPMRKATNKCNFPAPIGAVSTMLLYAEEMVRLAKKKDINTTKVYGANIGPRATFVCLIAKVFHMYRSHKNIDRAAKWLVKASQKDMRKLTPAYGVQVNVLYDSGEPVIGHLMLEDTYQATGVTIGITARAIFEGRATKPGVFMLHEAIHDSWFMQQLQQSGLIKLMEIQSVKQWRTVEAAQ
jgi:saccharopine dehydrogenase-like NADP-dependent oxidoreductase